MRILKSNPVLTLVNSYLVDNPEPSTISYLWNFGSLLGLCLVAQIVSGILIAMHYSGTAELGFNSVEHFFCGFNLLLDKDLDLRKYKKEEEKITIYLNKFHKDNFNEWFRGLVDGEGYFIIGTRKRKCPIRSI